MRHDNHNFRGRDDFAFPRVDHSYLKMGRYSNEPLCIAMEVQLGVGGERVRGYMNVFAKVWQCVADSTSPKKN